MNGDPLEQVLEFFERDETLIGWSSVIASAQIHYTRFPVTSAANLLRTFYGETGAMDFGFYKTPVSWSSVVAVDAVFDAEFVGEQVEFGDGVKNNTFLQLLRDSVTSEPTRIIS